MIPSSESKEWRELIYGSYNVKIISHSLKMELNLIRKKFINGHLTTEEAVEELHKYCSLHYDLYKKDICSIFGK